MQEVEQRMEQLPSGIRGLVAIIFPDFVALYGPGQPLDPGYARSNTLTFSGLQVWRHNASTSRAFAVV